MDSLSELTSKENLDEDDRPAHQVTFYDFGCKQILNGKLKGNEDERLVLLVQDKEYEFSLYSPTR
jgi:hypothetical protein